MGGELLVDVGLHHVVLRETANAGQAKAFFFVADRQPDVQISVPAWEDEGKLGSNGRAKLALNCTSAQLLLLLL